MSRHRHIYTTLDKRKVMRLELHVARMMLFRTQNTDLELISLIYMTLNKTTQAIEIVCQFRNGALLADHIVIYMKMKSAELRNKTRRFTIQ